MSTTWMPGCPLMQARVEGQTALSRYFGSLERRLLNPRRKTESATSALAGADIAFRFRSAAPARRRLPPKSGSRRIPGASMEIHPHVTIVSAGSEVG